MSESTTPAQCREDDWNLARDCGLMAATPGTNAWDAALRRFAEDVRAAAPSASAQPAGEEMVRFCPECGLLGHVPAGCQACCPDASHARIVPKKFAESCRQTFRLLADKVDANPIGNLAPPGASTQQAKRECSACDGSGGLLAECHECHGTGSMDVMHEPLRDGYTETYGRCCDTCHGTGKTAMSASKEGT